MDTKTEHDDNVVNAWSKEVSDYLRSKGLITIEEACAKEIDVTDSLQAVIDLVASKAEENPGGEENKI